MNKKFFSDQRVAAARRIKFGDNSKPLHNAGDLGTVIRVSDDGNHITVRFDGSICATTVCEEEIRAIEISHSDKLISKKALP
jgi:hypothetical protein